MEAKAKLRFNRGIVVLLVLACFHALFSGCQHEVNYQKIIASKRKYCSEAKKQFNTAVREGYCGKGNYCSYITYVEFESINKDCAGFTE